MLRARDRVIFRLFTTLCEREDLRHKGTLAGLYNLCYDTRYVVMSDVNTMAPHTYYSVQDECSNPEIMSHMICLLISVNWIYIYILVRHMLSTLELVDSPVEIYIWVYYVRWPSRRMAISRKRPCERRTELTNR